VIVRGVSTQQTSSQRPLQGQSPYAVNLSLSYRHPTLESELSVFYHVFGRRINSVGYETMPDVYEEERHAVDLSFSQPLGKLQAKFKATNLLNPAYEYTQGGEITRRYRTGRSFSLGISYSI